jgi:hypothetical protein
MDTSGGLEVRVVRCGEKFSWELHREGISRAVKFSVPIFLSEASAIAFGTAARTAHLVRLAKSTLRKAGGSFPTSI